MEWMDDRLRMALLKEKSAYREFWKKFGGAEGVIATYRLKQEYYKKNPDPIGHVAPGHNCPADKDFYEFVVGLFGSFGIVVTDELTYDSLQKNLEALNPYPEELPDPLPFHFRQSPAVTQLVDWNINNAPSEHDYTVPVDVAIKRLQPWERLVRIDLRRRNEDILNELSRFLKRVAASRKNPESCNHLRVTADCRVEHIDWADNYEQWQLDDTRARVEVWRNIKIYRMRRGANKKNFKQIGKELGMKADAAKQAFASVYSRIEGRKYDNDKKLLKKVDKEELKRTCATCRDKPERGGNCKVPCQDVMSFIKQDYGSRTGQSPRTGVAYFAPSRHGNKARLTDD